MANQNVVLQNLISQGIVVAALHQAQIALNHAQGVLKGNLAAGVGLSDIPKMLLHAERSLPPQFNFFRGNFAADELDRMAERNNGSFIVELQAEIFTEISVNLFHCLPSCLFSIDQQKHIIHKPSIVRNVHCALDVVIQRRENNISSHLAYD